VSRYRAYFWIVVGASVGWAGSLVIPGMHPVVGLAAGAAAGLAVGGARADEAARCFPDGGRTAPRRRGDH
jgi:hypothetical protein